MIKLPKFKQIFPVNRTRVFPNWGNSYVDDWIRFETFIGGDDEAIMCVSNEWGVMYFGTPNQPDRNGRIYSPDIWEQFATCRAPRIEAACVASFPHPGIT